MIIKIISALLIAGAVFMGIKQGYAMVSGKQQMVEMFSQWNIGKTGVAVIGTLTIIGALLILPPKSFIYGNFLMAAVILLIICFHLADKDFKGVGIEIPFLALNLLIIYLGHPLQD